MSQVDGFLFINQQNLSLAGLRSKISTYKSQEDAQAWLNIVLLDGLITDVVGNEWEDDDPGVAQIASVVCRAWPYQIQYKFPGARFSIEKVSDTEYGDFGLRLGGSTA